MGFTVAYPGGTTDAEFITYARVLRQTGKDLSNLPRVPEPGSQRRWLAFWEDREGAGQFARTLNERADRPGWEVAEVPGPPSEGPLVPLVVQFLRQGDGATFLLHPNSRAILRALYPEKVGFDSVTLDPETWEEFVARRRSFPDLARRALLGLTALTWEQLTDLGHVVLDVQSGKTLIQTPPAGLSPAAASSAASPVAV